MGLLACCQVVKNVRDRGGGAILNGKIAGVRRVCPQKIYEDYVENAIFNRKVFRLKWENSRVDHLNSLGSFW